MQIIELWRYPVKSMLGERLDFVDLDRRGVEGDRQFAIRDVDGKFGSGKNTRRFRKIDGLFEFTATYADDTVVVRFPDGSTYLGDDPGINVALSNCLGQPVTLSGEGTVSHFDAGPFIS